MQESNVQQNTRTDSNACGRKKVRRRSQEHCKCLDALQAWVGYSKSPRWVAQNLISACDCLFEQLNLGQSFICTKIADPCDN